MQDSIRGQDELKPQSMCCALCWVCHWLGSGITHFCGPQGVLPLWAQALLAIVGITVVTAIIWLLCQLGDHLWYRGTY